VQKRTALYGFLQEASQRTLWNYPKGHFGPSNAPVSTLYSGLKRIRSVIFKRAVGISNLLDFDVENLFGIEEVDVNRQCGVSEYRITREFG
jgi:hypothetical protein